MKYRLVRKLDTLGKAWFYIEKWSFPFGWESIDLHLDEGRARTQFQILKNKQKLTVLDSI